MANQLSDHGGAKTSPYVGFYNLALRQAIPLLDDKSLRLLMTLATYVNGEGLCWPGYRALAEVTGYRHETIQATLDKLVSMGFVRYKRRNAVDPYTKQKLPNIYEIVGLVHTRVNQTTAKQAAVDEDHEAVAAAGREYAAYLEAQAEPAPKPSPFAKTAGIKPAPQTELPVPPVSTNAEQNQQQNQIQQTSFVEPVSENQQQQPSKPEKAAQVQKAPESAGTGPNTAKTTAKIAASDSPKQEKTNADNSKTEAETDLLPNELYFQQRGSAIFSGVPRGGGRRLNLDCENFATPFADETLEQFAKRVHREVKPITLPNARRLIGTYGAARVEAAVTHLSKLSNIYNPPGFLVMLLRRSEVDAEADGPYAPQRTMEEEFDEITARNYQMYVAGWEDYIDH